MTDFPQREDRPKLAATLRAVHVGLREDLDVSRHLFRGTPAYIVRDPMTFQSQRLERGDYEIFTSIRADRSLGDTFQALELDGSLTVEDEERFYQFVLSLHRLGFLRLPIADDKMLFKRYQMRLEAKRRTRIQGFLFLRVPLWNPDAFLSRTMHYVRPLFTTYFFVFWLLLVGSALYVALMNRRQLYEPLEGLLAARNLPVMWLTLVGLKLFHEFGHAYACKNYGGHVPEMGAYLIALTPCAYVDASASWGFTHKRRRLVVCLAGMYFEAILAALAVFIWAATEHSRVHALAYNVMFLASVVTVLFNINPLMRFDGYYVFSDLVEIPNLRQRSSQHLLNVLKRSLLGLRIDLPERGKRLGTILLTYGVAAAIYRATLMIAITAMLITKMFLLGLILGAGMLGGLVLRMARQLTRYLWHSEETAPVRVRAIALGALVLLVLPTLATLVPWPANVYAAGLVTAQHETIVRARVEGRLEEIEVEPGQTIAPGDRLVRLANESLAEEIVEAAGRVRAARLRRDAFRVNDPGRALQEETELRLGERILAESQEKQADLEVRAGRGGFIVECPTDSDIGAFLQIGAPIATVISGSRRARALLTQDEAERADPRIGDDITFRSTAAPGRTVLGTVASVLPAGSRSVRHAALTQLGGGDIAVNPADQRAAEPYFEVVIELSGPDAMEVPFGSTGNIRFTGRTESLAQILGRRFLRFWNRLSQD